MASVIFNNNGYDYLDENERDRDFSYYQENYEPSDMEDIQAQDISNYMPGDRLIYVPVQEPILSQNQLENNEQVDMPGETIPMRREIEVNQAKKHQTADSQSENGADEGSRIRNRKSEDIKHVNRASEDSQVVNQVHESSHLVNRASEDNQPESRACSTQEIKDVELNALTKDTQDTIDHVTGLIKSMREHAIAIIKNMNELETDLLATDDEVPESKCEKVSDINNGEVGGSNGGGVNCGNGGESNGSSSSSNKESESNGGTGKSVHENCESNGGGNGDSNGGTVAGENCNNDKKNNGKNDCVDKTHYDSEDVKSDGCTDDTRYDNQETSHGTTTTESSNEKPSCKPEKPKPHTHTCKHNNNSSSTNTKMKSNCNSNLDAAQVPVVFNEWSVPLRNDGTVSNTQATQEFMAQAQDAIRSWKSQIEACKRILDDAVAQAAENEKLNVILGPNLIPDAQNDFQSTTENIGKRIPDPFEFLNLPKSHKTEPLPVGSSATNVKKEPPPAGSVANTKIEPPPGVSAGNTKTEPPPGALPGNANLPPERVSSVGKDSDSKLTTFDPVTVPPTHVHNNATSTGAAKAAVNKPNPGKSSKRKSNAYKQAKVAKIQGENRKRAYTGRYDMLRSKAMFNGYMPSITFKLTK